MAAVIGSEVGEDAGGAISMSGWSSSSQASQSSRFQASYAVSNRSEFFIDLNLEDPSPAGTF
jgi:hypothetical protein